MPLSLTDLLVSEEIAAPDLVDRALARQMEAGGSLDTALFELAPVDEDGLLHCLSLAAELPAAPGSAYEQADPRSRRVFPSKVAERHCLAPFALDGRELSLVSAFPVDVPLLEEISFMLSLHLRAHVGPEWKVRQLIQRLYATPLTERFQQIVDRKAALLADSEPEPPLPPFPEPPSPFSTAGSSVDEAEEAEIPVYFSLDGSEPEPLVAALAQVLEESEAADLLSRPRLPPPEIDRSVPEYWSLEEAGVALAAARSRDEVVLIALRYCRVFFEYAALLAVTRSRVAGHDALGDGADARDRCRRLSLSRNEPGIVHTVIETCGPHLGPFPPGLGSTRLTEGLGRNPPRTGLLYPVMLRDRPVCILYADNGEAPVSPRRLGDLLMLAGGLGAAFERIIREQKRKEQRAESPPGGPSANSESNDNAPGEEANTEPGPGEDTALPEASAELIEQEVVPSVEESRPDRVADAIAEQLVATTAGSAERADLVRSAVEHGAEVAPVLAARLPGPLEGDTPGEEGSPAELGPVFAALAAMGNSATEALLPLLEDDDPERRRAAALLLGHSGDPAAYLALADLAFDSNTRVASGVRWALRALRRRPNLRPVIEKLRRALLSEIPERSVNAAMALEELRDSGAIPLLVQVLEVSNANRIAAASHALSVITLEQHGKSAQRWLAWWKENRGRPRAKWLLDALRSGDRDVRAAAAEELRAAGPSPIPYSPDAPEEERNVSAEAWAELWEQSAFVV